MVIIRRAREFSYFCIERFSFFGRIVVQEDQFQLYSA